MEYEVIYHHGIKGMKWGIRRTPAQLGHYIKKRKTAKKRKAALEKARAAKAEKAKQATSRKELLEKGKISPKQMTDAELNAAIKRAELENRYNQLHPKQVSAGEKFLKNTLGPKLSQAVATVATEYLTKKAKDYLGLSEKKDNDRSMSISDALKNVDKLSDKELQSVINRGNNEKTLKNLVKDAIGKPDKKTDISELSKNVDKLSDDDLADLLKRMNTEKAIKKLLEEKDSEK